MSEIESYTLEGKTFNVIDKRRNEKGKIVYYCIYCQRLSEDVEMSEVGLGLTPNSKEDGSSLIFKKDSKSIMPKTKEVWRVFLHYDGCRGWD